jgi:hypothetical protein
MAPNNHSNIARKVVNTLIVGQLERKSETVEYTIKEKQKANDFTSTIILTPSNTAQNVPIITSNLSTFGKHYLVRLTKQKNLKR